MSVSTHSGVAYPSTVAAGAIGASGVNRASSSAVTFTSGILDSASITARMAYSTRRLRVGYSGPALRAWKTGGTTQDIGFTSAGNLDESALSTFAAGGDVFVSIWYDQSGNASDLVQATSAAMPRIVASGTIDRVNSRAAIRTDGSSDFMTPAVAVTTNQPYTRSSVLRFASVSATGSPVLYDGVSAATSGLFFGADGSLQAYAGTTVALVNGLVANDTATLVELYNGAASEFRYNRTLNPAAAGGTINPGALGTTQVYLGCQAGNTGFANTYYGELIVVTSALGATPRSALEVSQQSYWGTP